MNVLGTLLGGVDDGSGGDTAARLSRIERKLDLILQHLGLEYALPAVSPQVSEYIRQGKKIEAIKAYREETGAGLKEAKDAVDAMEAEIGR